MWHWGPKDRCQCPCPTGSYKETSKKNRQIIGHMTTVTYADMEILRVHSVSEVVPSVWGLKKKEVYQKAPQGRCS